MNSVRLRWYEGQEQKKQKGHQRAESHNESMVKQFQTLKIKIVLGCDSDLNNYTSLIKTHKDLFKYLEAHRGQLNF